MDSIGIEATSRSSGDVHPLSFPTVIGLLCLVILLGIISSRALRARGLAVHHLFLKIQFKRENQEKIGFVRTLDIDRVKLVTAEAPAKGDHLVLNLSSLPGYPEPGRITDGTVIKVRQIGGNNLNYLVDVSLAAPKMNKQDYDSLVDYLRHLHT